MAAILLLVLLFGLAAAAIVYRGKILQLTKLLAASGQPNQSGDHRPNQRAATGQSRHAGAEYGVDRAARQ